MYRLKFATCAVTVSTAPFCQLSYSPTPLPISPPPPLSPHVLPIPSSFPLPYLPSPQCCWHVWHLRYLLRRQVSEWAMFQPSSSSPLPSAPSCATS